MSETGVSMSPSSRWRILAALFVPVSLAVAVAVVVLLDRDGPAPTRPTERSAASVTQSTLQPPTRQETNEDLERRYKACVQERGFDPDFVQVVRDGSEPPRWVKTGREVPAAIHGPCFRVIGGSQKEHWSSYGNER